MTPNAIPFDDASHEQRKAKYPDGSYVFGPSSLTTESEHVVIRRDDLRHALAYIELDMATWALAGSTHPAVAAIDRLEIALGGKLR